MVSGKVAFGNTALAKLLPLVLVVPLTLRLQTLVPEIHLSFDVVQFAYVLAIGVTVVISFIEFRVAQAEKRGAASINAGSFLAGLTTIAGVIILIYVLAFNYIFNDEFINDIITVYLFFAIFLLIVQATRELTGARKLVTQPGIFGQG